MVPRGVRDTPSAGLESTVGDVPRISFFYGIAIYVYWDEGVHARPHFHALQR
jgi:hypothetical protein